MQRSLFDHIANGDVAAVKGILDADPTAAQSLDSNGLPPIMYALYHRQAAVVDLISEYLSDFSIFEAAARGDLKRVNRLIQKDPTAISSFSSDGFTALHLASFFSHLELVELLVNEGADVNAVAQNASWVSPIHSAAAAQSPEIVEQLLAGGADPNAQQMGGWTALHSAAKHGDAAMVTLLLRYGADPKVVSEDGLSALDLSESEEVDAIIRNHGESDAGE